MMILPFHRTMPRSIATIFLFLSLLAVGCDRKDTSSPTTRPAPSAQATGPDSQAILNPAVTQPSGAAPGRAVESPLVVAGPKNISMLPIIAGKRGLLSPSTSFRPIQTGKLTMDGVVAGDVDAGVLVDTNIAYAGFQKDADIVVIAVIMEKTDDGLVVLSQEVKSPADLLGKKIAYTPATTSDSFLWRFLHKNGLSTDQVTLLSSLPPAIQPAMTSGEIAAASVWEPWKSSIRKRLGPQAHEFHNDNIYTCHAVLVVKRTTLKARQAQLKTLLQNLIEAETWINANPAEARALLAVEIPIDLPVLEQAWNDYSPKVSLSPKLLVNLNEEGEHIRKIQDAFRTREQPDYRRFIDTTLLKELAPDRVAKDGP